MFRNFLPQIFLGRNQDYDLERLVDRKFYDDKKSFQISKHHIICDIDKTYLETEFQTVSQMVKIAFEEARDKITVWGATEVLMAARWGNLHDPSEPKDNGFKVPRPLHFVSSSPHQLRNVLTEKLLLDGVDWSSDTFKNQAYNIRRGRIDLLRHQVAYKSYAILQLIKEINQDGIELTLIGDNAESDPYIYLGLRLFLSGKLSKNGYVSYLEHTGVEKKVAYDFHKILDQIPKAEVKMIMIRNVPGYKMVEFSPLTEDILQFDNFFFAALIFSCSHLIEEGALWRLVRSFHNRHGMSRKDLLAEVARVGEALPRTEALSLALDKIHRRLSGESLKEYSGVPRYQGFQALANLSEEQILHLADGWLTKIRHYRAERETQQS